METSDKQLRKRTTKTKEKEEEKERGGNVS
jgi:hypothetical protein